jgi:hypothetical protein
MAGDSRFAGPPTAFGDDNERADREASTASTARSAAGRKNRLVDRNGASNREGIDDRTSIFTIRGSEFDEIGVQNLDIIGWRNVIARSRRREGGEKRQPPK